ncbi:MAG: hypothetical protein SGPRY_000206 [Prymnesium sp.]
MDSPNCTLLLFNYDKGTPPNEEEIREELESKEIPKKVEGLKTLISLLLSGESMPKLLMTVIRFCVPCDDHKIKKLLLFYWEIVEKTGPDGKLLPEMILVCNNLRNDLNHPNEYIRGCTLRFLCKLKEAEILEPLIPTIKNNLEHRHSFVRRNAVLTVFAVHKSFEYLLPDAPDVCSLPSPTDCLLSLRDAACHLLTPPSSPATSLIEKVLLTETDAATKRNAFLMLFHCAQDRAAAFLSDNLDQAAASPSGLVASYGDVLQLVVLELIRKVVRANPLDKSKYIRCILTLFNSQSNAVVYECASPCATATSCASALVALSSSATAIRAAANSYTQLLSSQSDNNIKLIVLERLQASLEATQSFHLTQQSIYLRIQLSVTLAFSVYMTRLYEWPQDLKKQHSKVLQEMVMDIMRALSSANLDIRQKTLDITLDLIAPKSIAEVLKKEVQKTQGEDGEKNSEYRSMLINAIHQAAIRFPESASTVVPVLMDFLGDSNQAGVALWLVGEYCVAAAEVASAFAVLKSCLGPVPFKSSGFEGVDAPAPTPRAEGRPVVLADGSYASQASSRGRERRGGGVRGREGRSGVEWRCEGGEASRGEAGDGRGVEGVFASTLAKTRFLIQTALEDGSGLPPGEPKLRGLLVGGDFFLATVVATTLTKLVLRTREHVPPAAANLVAADVMLLLTGLLQLGKAGQVGQSIDPDSQERIAMYLQVLSDPAAETAQLYLAHCREAFSTMLSERQAAEAAEKPAKNAIEADDLIVVRQLRGRSAEMSAIDLDDDDDLDLSKATGLSKQEDFSTRLKRVTQLTGLSDAVYAEAYVSVHSYDIMLDVLVVNQTKEPMHNLCLELATVGDLKLCERPQSYTLLPAESKHIKANIKVSSTETGIVFGSIVYDNNGSATPTADRYCVVLNDIHIDIMDYIAPASCSDLTFRAMWAEFEWENKMAVNTDITDVTDFLMHVVKSTNMKCLTPQSALEGRSGFLAANLYAKSIFGEDALVNVSVERRNDGKIAGYIRIRSKTQGIALSLGDKITLKQKKPEPNSS